MKKIFKYVTVLTLILGFAKLNAQDLENYNWGNGKYITQNAQFATESQVYILRKQLIEINYNTVEDKITKIQSSHFIIQLNDEVALKVRQELELPTVSNSREILQFQVRIIKKDGTIITFEKSDIKEKPESQRPKSEEEEEEEDEEEESQTSEEEEEEDTYEYYDLSSLKLGDQLEYFFVEKTPNPSLSGTYFIYQGKIPIQQFEYELNATKEFSFLIKTYNNAPTAVKDSTNKVRSVYRFTDKMVVGIKREKFSNYYANMRSVIFKLDGYELGKKRNVYTFEGFSTIIYNNTYKVSKRELAIIKKVMKQSKMKLQKTDKDKVIALENHLKTNFFVFNLPGLNNVFDIENMYNFNIISTDAAVRLFANALKLSKIEHELVVTCDRYDYRFDKEFQTNYFFDNIILYLNSEKKFMDPGSSYCRLGMIPSSLTNNHALFIRQITVGDLASGLGTIKFIDAPNRDFSTQETEVIVNFASDLKSVDIDFLSTLTGYFAANYQPSFDKLDAEQRVKYDNALIRFMDKDMEIVKSEYLNTEKSDVNVKPFIVKASASSKALLKADGDNLIFKVGMLIGEQSDLYEEETRQLPIENGFSRGSKRSLKITLPDGYSCENLDDLTQKFEVTNDKGQVAAQFHSSYVLNGNILVITIEEWYQDLQLPASKYADFRNIINASADFAKIELLLKK